MKIAVALALVLALGLAIVWMVGSALLGARHHGGTDDDLPPLSFRLETRDGLSIAASFRPGRRPDAPGVLLLHGLGADRGQTEGNAAFLAGLGYATLTLDFRGHGASTNAATSFGLDEGIEARAAFDRLKRETGGAPVAVVGISLGGAAALIGRDGPLPTEALVLVGVFADIRHAIGSRVAYVARPWLAPVFEPLLSFQSLPRYGVWPWRIAPIEALQARRGPTLLVGGGADVFTPPSEVEAMARAAGGPAEVWIAPGLGHDGVSSIETEAFRSRLVDFLGRTIGAP